DLIAILDRPNAQYNDLLRLIDEIAFVQNDTGEIAELHFWKGKVLSLLNKRHLQSIAAKSFARCLISGAPRKRYDESALKALTTIHAKLATQTELHRWIRELMNYNGILFEDITPTTPISGQRFTRIAIGDYDNNGYPDLLFNGNRLYSNESGKGFADVSESANVANLKSNGGLWADFNLDGHLDFMTISHNTDGMGERLMKNMDGTRFVSVNERAGDIDDLFHTEGAAWIDIDGSGYPSIYTANYETWQQRSGYPDFFWYNDKGYFSDLSDARGMRLPAYADKPGLAGRGVAPADFDNDGKQEILVTNYRLNRNICWKQADSLFVDIAPLYGLAGTNKNGYYGHSIGADWGDFDNDGDLDLFVANLAHPRYIDISDVSMLLRNDGLSYHVVETDTIYYWKFTDITREAGITFDELHSDPLWFDADNDGFLDLFITSVYENDRSYLYRNNKDGTFTDITWLANARVYNGWGNASADLDRDGLPDLVVGSGNGTKILINRTQTRNRAVYVKPVWKSGAVLLPQDPGQFHQFPNSPAYGTRVKVILRHPSGKIYSLVRELSSAKGTTSQNAQELHFGIGRSSLVSIKRVHYGKD
ncbi:MAG: CRTAC1 family protein, partial [Candidatus Cloacimonadaceae bacterium]|nr:CRTAC1 family protein [Candidatus Cloacimonadaceae bacterium]